MIYFIQNLETLSIKIGFTDDEEAVKRLCSCQVGNEFELVIKATVEGSIWLEKRLHAICWDLHIRGEWFKFEAFKRCQQYFQGDDVLKRYKEDTKNKRLLTLKKRRIYDDFLSLLDTKTDRHFEDWLRANTEILNAVIRCWVYQTYADFKELNKADLEAIDWNKEYLKVPASLRRGFTDETIEQIKAQVLDWD